MHSSINLFSYIQGGKINTGCYGDFSSDDHVLHNNQSQTLFGPDPEPNYM